MAADDMPDLRPSRRDLLVGGAALVAAGTAYARMPRRPTMMIGKDQLDKLVPLKINISRAAVALLDACGMTIARKGVIIQVDQYDILVAAACAGLNSIISLSAIGLFYIYVRHNANWRYALFLMIAILPVAVLANFVRVLLLILITDFMGDAWAQGFLHGFAGMVMFAVALLSIFGIDRLAEPIRRRLATRSAP